MSRSTDSQTPIVICSVLERDAASAQRRIGDAPAGCGLVELRADALDPGDVQRIVAASERELIVTVRRPEDGGSFAGSEDDRRALLRGALAAGACRVDVEWNGPLRELASGEDASRVILSHHGAACVDSELAALYREMRGTPAFALKIVPEARRVADVAAVKALLACAREDGRRLAAFAMGRAGASSRILCGTWGSWATYGALDAASPTATGQLACRDLIETYRFGELGRGTRRFALIGARVFGSPSPAMHAAAYRRGGIDACYVPLEVDDADEVRPLLGDGGCARIEAFGVTIPHKEPVAAACARLDPLARAAGAVNTVRVLEDGSWEGHNTDGPGALDRMRPHLDPLGKAVAVVGAGGTGRAVAAVLKQAGALVTLFNRTERRARTVAEALGVDSAPLDALGRARFDALVNTAPRAMGEGPILDRARLAGRLVLDFVYAPGGTGLAREALAAGCVVVDGTELLAAQAVRQYALMTGRQAAFDEMRGVGEAWLARRVAVA
ncbi:MAG: type I 3-dehydroquinate dehydratase [bacterium]|nr:type I 3-dehydroquinate dehydratase [bacterium]